MRRNKIFKIEDLVNIVEEMSLPAMQDFFKQMEHASYIKVRIPSGKKNKPKKFMDRTYGLIKNTGALCPVWIRKQRRLYDRNIQEVQMRDMLYVPKVSKKIEHRPVDALEYAKGRVIQILQDDEEGLPWNLLQFRCGLSPDAMTVAAGQLIRDNKVTTGRHKGVCVWKMRGGRT